MYFFANCQHNNYSSFAAYILIARFGSAGVNNKKKGLAMNLEKKIISENKLFQHSTLWSFINHRPIHHIVVIDHFPCSIITSQN